MRPVAHFAISARAVFKRFITPKNPHVHWHSGFFVANDDARTEAISAEVINAYGRGHKVLVLTERTELLDAIHVCSARMNSEDLSDF
jgi:hypothetical protein